ncbi:MAG: hypothetical protein PHN45_00350 [Methylococcales bacterium]|nr:hypothetical protein [Methylococcales bacterium]MDD5753190.1 hypothetical protein [Methylococcales bacterium]
MLPYELEFLIALCLTISIEFVVIVFLIKVFYEKEEFNIREIIWAGALPSMATLPYVWFVFPYFVANRHIYVISVEVFAVIVESFIIALILRIGLKQGFLFSFISNMVSATLGFFLEGMIVDFLLNSN